MNVLCNEKLDQPLHVTYKNALSNVNKELSFSLWLDWLCFCLESGCSSEEIRDQFEVREQCLYFIIIIICIYMILSGRDLFAADVNKLDHYGIYTSSGLPWMGDWKK
jgi:hypothetical protein